MSEIRVEGVDEAIARLNRFRFSTLATEWADTVSPTMSAALREALAAKSLPRKSGGGYKPSVRSMRHTSAESMDLIFSTPPGGKPYDIPNAFGFGPDFGIGGRFGGRFHPPLNQGGGFAAKLRASRKRTVVGVWTAMREEVLGELRARIAVMLEG